MTSDVRELDALFEATAPAPASRPSKARSKVRGNRYELSWAKADKELANAALCGKLFQVFHHKASHCGAKIVSPFSCDSRACKQCAKRRSAKLTARYSEAVKHFKRAAMIALTVPNVRTVEELPGALERLVRGFKKLRERMAWRKCPGFWSLEITYSASKGFHPHLHCIADLPWLDLNEISRVWSELTGARHQPDVKRPNTPEKKAGMVREAIKYVTKAWELPQEALRAILAVIGGRRMFNSFGGLVVANEAHEPYPCNCPGCGERFPGLRGHLHEWDIYLVQPEEVQAMRLGPRWADVFAGWRAKEAAA